MAAKTNKKKVTQKKVVAKKPEEKIEKKVEEVSIKTEEEKIEEVEKTSVVAEEVKESGVVIDVLIEAEKAEDETTELPVEEKVELIEKLKESGVEIPDEPETVAPTELSPMAKKWKAYLALQRQTPEDFIKKYEKTNHKFLHIIREIIAFEKNKSKVFL